MFVNKYTPEGDMVTEGILNDWDLCKYQEEIKLAASQTSRTVCLYLYRLMIMLMYMMH